jgi:hypothetical protein
MGIAPAPESPVPTPGVIGSRWPAASIANPARVLLAEFVV